MVYISKKHRFRCRISKSYIMFYERKNTRKVCVNFQPSDDEGERKDPQTASTSDRPKKCRGCNYLESEHFQFFKPKPWSRAKNWRSDLHLDSVDFGKNGINRKIRVISELGGIEKTANLTIVADDTHPMVIVEHLVEDWKLSLPNICISVIGTTGRQVNMLPRNMARLKQGLLTAVCSTSCWVLTGGTNQGVDAVTCDTLKDAQMTSWMGTQDAPEFEILGIVNWNCISQHQQMSRWTFENANVNEPFEYHIRKGTFDSSSGERFPAFNPLCSLFVGIESGIQSNKGAETFVRSSLEELIQADPNDNTQFNGVGLNIPTVLILIGGDFDTFERASNAVVKEIPIILCEGSGLATDILATAIRMSQKNFNLQLNKEQEQVLTKLMETQLSAKPPKGKIFPTALFEGSRHIPFLRKCVEHRRLVFFYRIDLSVSHLDVAIMRALLKSGPARRKDPVQLAVRWNRCDEVVEEHLKGSAAPSLKFPKSGGILSSNKSSPVHSKKEFGFDINEKPNIKELVTQTLLEDKTEFIKLFLEHGLDIRKYLTTTQLAEIYEEACENYPPLVKLLKKARNGRSKPYFKIKHVYNLIHTWTSARPQHNLQVLPDNRHNGPPSLRTFEDPFRELCIWAILTHKMDMALFFWSKCKTPLMMALIASRLWEAHRYAMPARDEEIRQEMLEYSKFFAQLALDMIEQAWHVNKQMAKDMVTYKYRAFGRVNAMDLSAFIEAKEIIAHPLVQVAIDGMWKGGLRASLKQVLIAFLCPFRIPIFFQDMDTDELPASDSAGKDVAFDKEVELGVTSEDDEEKEMLRDKEQASVPKVNSFEAPTSIAEFMQEDEETQKLLKARRELIRRTEIAKLEALRREKIKLLESSTEGDVFARAAAALQKIQQIKDENAKEVDPSHHGTDSGGDSDSDQDSGVEEDAHRHNKLYDPQGAAQHQDEVDSEDSEMELENEKPDHDICQYQVQHLDEVQQQEEEDARMSQQVNRTKTEATTASSAGNNQGFTGIADRKPSKKHHGPHASMPREGLCAVNMDGTCPQPDPAAVKNMANKAANWFQSQKQQQLHPQRKDVASEVLELHEETEGKAALEQGSEETKPQGKMTTTRMLLAFYTSPIAKFCMHTIAYLVFLALFTKSIFETGQGMKSIWGLLSFQFMICYALEAYRQLVTQRADWGMKLRIWAMSEWNIIELVYLSMGLVSFPLTSWELTRNTAIMMNCCINMLMWIRLLRFYQCSSRLGPMWIMIRKMMTETLWFLAIFTILLLSYGIFIMAVSVPSQEDLYLRNMEMSAAAHDHTQTTPSSSTSVSEIVQGGSGRNSYEFEFSIATNSTDEPNYDDIRMPFWTKKSWIFLRPYLMSLGNHFLDWSYIGRNFRVTTWSSFFFVVVGNALMLNLLVAIYGGIFNDIVEKADIEWKTEMYWLMVDFKSKTFLPPPISIVETFGLWLHFVCLERKKAVPSKTALEQKKIESLGILENYCVQTVLEMRDKVKTSLDTTNTVIKNREINCGKIQESIQNIHDLRAHLSHRRHEREEKRRERQRTCVSAM